MKYIITALATGLGMYVWFRRETETFVKQMTDEINMRTDLINWLSSEGVYLDAEDFWPAFSERAKFINIVTLVQEA